MDWLTSLGFLAAACTTISFVPQSIKIIKTKHTKDISLGMYLLLTTGVLLWSLYGILIDDLPLLIANAITLLFTATILFLKIKHK